MALKEGWKVLLNAYVGSLLPKLFSISLKIFYRCSCLSQEFPTFFSYWKLSVRTCVICWFISAGFWNPCLQHLYIKFRVANVQNHLIWIMLWRVKYIESNYVDFANKMWHKINSKPLSKNFCLSSRNSLTMHVEFLAFFL